MNISDIHFAKQVDAEIFNVFEKWQRQMKVATVIGQVHKKFENEKTVTFDFIARRIYALVDSRELVAYGNIKNGDIARYCPLDMLHKRRLRA